MYLNNEIRKYGIREKMSNDENPPTTTVCRIRLFKINFKPKNVGKNVNSRTSFGINIIKNIDSPDKWHYLESSKELQAIRDAAAVAQRLELGAGPQQERDHLPLERGT
jgi:hypothetical protein